MEIILKEHNRQAVTGWVKKITPLIEAALKKNANKAHDPEGDLHSMNLCGEAGKAIQQEDLSPHGIVGGQLFGVVANGHSAIHVGYYAKDTNLVIDPTAGQWGDSKGNYLSTLIQHHPDLFVGRILVATPEEIQEKLGWEYRVLQ